ncbi:hypothetical protein BDV59DRAFT_170798 [Aspergillus ambiguus]|uniref:uncharacterized protein n=1 Tax=Aspergillus ambiguus TaxID=176160 RepID=UPI003CCD1764
MVGPSSQVSWQSAFWALVPLALVTMLQPSGRVCSFHPRLRTYLRGSPFVCAADGLAILFRFAIYWVSGRSSCLAAQMTLSIRFSATDNAEDELSETVRGLEKLTIVRWLGFFIGSLSQALKLTAMQGIPWTKSWGYCYLTSFVIIEVLSLLAPFVEDLPTAELQPVISEEIQRLLSLVEQWLGYLAISAHIAFLVWAMPCWGETLCTVEKETSRPFQALSLMAFSFSVLGAYTVPKMWLHTRMELSGTGLLPSPGYPVLLMILPPDLAAVKSMLHEKLAIMLPSHPVLVRPIVYTALVMTIISWGSCFLVLGSFFVLPFITGTTDAYLVTVFWLFKLIFFILSVGVGGFMCTFGLSRFPVLRRQLFFLPPMQSDIYIPQPELQAWGNIVLLFSTLILTSLWYAWQYDPRGTVKPSWTEWLG